MFVMGDRRDPNLVGTATADWPLSLSQCPSHCRKNSKSFIYSSSLSQESLGQLILHLGWDKRIAFPAVKIAVFAATVQKRRLNVISRMR
jgi:hypothetical protein